MKGASTRNEEKRVSTWDARTSRNNGTRLEDPDWRSIEVTAEFVAS